MKNVWIRNIGQVITCDTRCGPDNLGIINKAEILIVDGKIRHLGTFIPSEVQKWIPQDTLEVNANGCFVSPGLVECHTHAIFSGLRSDEFYMRLKGTSYEEIQKKGGGIHSTVAATRLASDEALESGLLQRLDRFLRFGVTTLEIKSGYGLSLGDEIRCLEILKRISHPTQRVSTFLGAHVVPHDWQSHLSDYTDHVAKDMIPRVAQMQLAEFCDVFCDAHAFDVYHARKILESAKSQGLKIKMHADQLSCTRAAHLAAELGACSVDHLECMDVRDIEALKQARTTAVLIPGANFSMGRTAKAPARELLDAGVRVALSTDCNPGTSCSENLPLAMSLGSILLKMSAVEVWKAVTNHAAAALAQTEAGQLKQGARANLVLWDAEHFEEIPYRYGACLPKAVVSQGIWRNYE